MNRREFTKSIFGTIIGLLGFGLTTKEKPMTLDRYKNEGTHPIYEITPTDEVCFKRTLDCENQLKYYYWRQIRGQCWTHIDNQGFNLTLGR